MGRGLSTQATGSATVPRVSVSYAMSCIGVVISYARQRGEVSEGSMILLTAHVTTQALKYAPYWHDDTPTTRTTT